MANNITISDKNTGDSHTAAEYNTVKAFINSPLQTGLTFTSTYVLDGHHECSDYSISSGETWNITGTPGCELTFNLIVTSDLILTKGTGWGKDIHLLFGPTISAGTYRIYAKAFSGGVDIACPDISSTQTSNQILLTNDFIDSWTLTNPNTPTVDFTVAAAQVDMEAQGGSNISFFNNFLLCDTTFNNSQLVFRFDLSLNAASTNTYGVYLEIDSNNKLYLTNDSPNNDLTSRLTYVVGGSSTTVEISQTINCSWKIYIDGSTVYCSYHNGSGWVNAMTPVSAAYGTQTWSLSLNTGNTAAVSNEIMTVTNLYVTNYNFASLTP